MGIILQRYILLYEKSFKPYYKIDSVLIGTIHLYIRLKIIKPKNIY